MTTATIKVVRPARTFSFEGKEGPVELAAIDVIFSDGSEGSAITKPEKREEAFVALEALKDKPSEFDLEKKPPRNGLDQWKIKGYPGKPGGGGFGGKREWKDNSPSIEAQNAVNNATKLVSVMIEKAPKQFSADAAVVYVESMAPRLFALTQKLKNGATEAKPVAAPAAALGTPAGGEQSSSLPAEVTPAGAAAATWDDVEAKISGASDGRAGEGPTGSSEPSLEGEGSAGLSGHAKANGPLPSGELEELWAEAEARDLTHARVVVILKKAGQPIESWEDVDARQLRSLLGVTGGVA